MEKYGGAIIFQEWLITIFFKKKPMYLLGKYGGVIQIYDWLKNLSEKLSKISCKFLFAVLNSKLWKMKKLKITITMKL